MRDDGFDVQNFSRIRRYTENQVFPPEGMTALRCHTDPSDAEWAVFVPLLAPATRRGCHRKHDLRLVLSATLLHLAR